MRGPHLHATEEELVDTYVPPSCCRPLLAVTWPELVQEQLGKLSAEQLRPTAAEALAECKVSVTDALGSGRRSGAGMASCMGPGALAEGLALSCA